MNEKSIKIDAGFKEYKDDIFNFNERSTEIIKYCKVEKITLAKPTETVRSRNSSPISTFDFNNILFMKPKNNLQGDCNPLDMEMFKSSFNDWMNTASGDEGMPSKIYFRMFSTCIDDDWKSRL